MRVPLSWLAEYVEVLLEPEDLAQRLTLLGMEVQSIERWGEDWQNVVVGELLRVERHPRADRLSLTTVAVGDGRPLEIVCGATNIAVGQRVPVALPGAVLPGGRRIERTEKMGAVSNGMLCSGEELHLTADGEGILILPADARLGTPLADLYGDVVLDVDVKPNRGDALSLVGLAREVAAITGSTVRWPVTDPAETGKPVEDRLGVEVEDRELCPRFVARWAGGVTVRPSPERVQMRLLAAGMRPVSNVVDASNYVMLELGKPIHAFDAAAVARGTGKHAGQAVLLVRRAKRGERLETLDHVERELDPETLVIADPERVLAIAGVMGGAASEVGEGTTEVIIESAIFDPVSIRRTAQRHGLRSEASSRFEKGQELGLARIGADRAARLIAEWAGGQVAPGRSDTAPDEPGPLRVVYRPARIDRLLGTELTAGDQRTLLGRVGIETEAAEAAELVTVALQPAPILVEPAPGEAWAALIPTWRRDIVLEADVAEEVARLHGYQEIASVLPDTAMPAFRASPLGVRNAVRETLVGAGLIEVVTNALVSPDEVDTFGLRRPIRSVDGETDPDGQEPVVVTNPLSRDHSVMRQGLLGSLVAVVGRNLRHGHPDVAVFEIGKGYGRAGSETGEWWRLGFALTGPAEEPAWNRPIRPFDLDDAKGLVDLLCRRLRLSPPTWEPDGGEAAFHPGRTARGTARRADTTGEPVLHALVGELHPALLDRLDLRAGPVVAAELSVEGLGTGHLEPVPVEAPPRQPAVERDLAIVVADREPAGRVAAIVADAAGDRLALLTLFDVYRGAPLGTDEKSLGYRLVFRAADRTLTEAEVDEAIAAVTARLAGELGARIRS